MQTLIKIFDFLKILFIEKWYYYLPFLIFIFTIYIFRKLYFNNLLGWWGEKKVARVFLKLNPEKYRIINNLMIEANGNTTQIDHLVISKYGIFIIESKNYYGYITGKDYGDWFLKIYRFKHRIGNPIIQNYIHMNVLKSLLGDYPDIIYYPIVVFTKRSIFNVNTKTDVIYNTDLLETIRKYRTEVISDYTRDKVYECLSDLNIKEKRIRREHIYRVKEKKINYEIKIKNDICPRCGGKLVIRCGGYGKFKGCSNFPKCRFTTDL